MRRKTLYALFCALFVMCGCAGSGSGNVQQAADDPKLTQAVAAPSGDDGDELICKKIKKTGSMRKTKVCATRDEWKAAEDDMTDWRDGLDSY